MRTLDQNIESARTADTEVRARLSGSTKRDCWRRAIGPSYRAVLAPLMRHDPIHINYGEGPEAYLPDSEAISARLSACGDEADVCRVVHEELCKSFGAGAVGSRENCTQIGREIWQHWQGRG